MSTISFPPPYHSPYKVAAQLRDHGYAVLQPNDAALWLDCDQAALMALVEDWNDLPPDEYLKDGGRYRCRRHASFVVQGNQCERVPHRPHWQPVQYNALHGGMERWFAPMKPEVAAQVAWQQMMVRLAQLSQQLFAASSLAPCYVEAHQFRIDTAHGIGRPTPEGAHRDGVDLVAVFLVGRQGIKGGETRVFEASGPTGIRFTLTQPWSLLLLDDARMIHETTPIQPVEQGQPGTRDTLVVTCRQHCFQGDEGKNLG
ncbi:MAG: 2OG-Fe dioxygenase family protein [Comamonas sp.]